MPFHPIVGDKLLIDGVQYCMAEHPAAPGMPYGQEGRQAVVFQITSNERNEHKALKVFKPRFHVPSLVSLSRELERFADLPGLSVCRRLVLTPNQDAAVLSRYPDLLYSVLMPWIEGPTWMEIVLGGKVLTPHTSLALTHALAHIMATMEQEGLAHCDLSGPNVLLPLLEGERPQTTNDTVPNTRCEVELVDVEQMYAHGLRRPEVVPAGSIGYAHINATEGLWTPNADRFAGALLLAEMLGWCDHRVRDASWGDSYFDPNEMQRESNRYRTLNLVLHERWGEEIARLFNQAWESSMLADCPTLGAWVVQLGRVGSGMRQTQVKQQLIQEPPISLPTLAQAAQPATFQAPSAESSSPQPYYETPSLAQASLDTVATSIYSHNPSTLAAPTGMDGTQQEVADLFHAGLAAHRHGEWVQALELLREVERREPGYTEGGTPAAILLRGVERRLAHVPARRRGWSWLILPAVVLGFVLGIGGITAYQAAETANTQATATVQAFRTLSAIVALEQTATSNATVTAAAAISATAEAAVTKTTQARVTANAQGTQLASANATSTSVAEFTVNAQAQHTAQALALLQASQETATAQLEATASAVAEAEAIAKARATATARLRPIKMLEGHNGFISSLAFSPDGRTLAAGAGNVILLWDVASGSQLMTLSGHLYSIADLEFSPDGRILASAADPSKDDGSDTENYTIKLWDVNAGTELRTLMDGDGYKRSISFSPDGKLLATNWIYGVKIWDVTSGAEIRAFSGHSMSSGGVETVAFSPWTNTVASQSIDKVTKLWDANSGIELKTMAGDSDNVISASVAFSPGGETVATDAGHGTIKLWDVASGTELSAIKAYEYSVEALEFTVDDDILVSSGDGTVKIWDVSSGVLIRALSSSEVWAISVKYSPNGAIIASAGRDGNIFLWDIGDLACTRC